MHIIARKALIEYSQRFPDTKKELDVWFHEASKADWKTPMDVKACYPKASILKTGRVVFNICHNTYRLVVKINYPTGTIFIRFFGTHAEYDTIDAEVV